MWIEGKRVKQNRKWRWRERDKEGRAEEGAFPRNALPCWIPSTFCSEFIGALWMNYDSATVCLKLFSLSLEVVQEATLYITNKKRYQDLYNFKVKNRCKR